MDATKPTLQELNRAMTADVREMTPDVLAWALELVEHRLTLIREGAPCRPEYELRLRVLRAAAQSSEMSLRPRPGETAEDVIERVTRAAKGQA